MAKIVRSPNAPEGEDLRVTVGPYTIDVGDAGFETEDQTLIDGALESPYLDVEGLDTEGIQRNAEEEAARAQEGHDAIEAYKLHLATKSPYEPAEPRPGTVEPEAAAEPEEKKVEEPAPRAPRVFTPAPDTATDGDDS